MKQVLTLIVATLASPALAHGDTPIHPDSPAVLMAALAVIVAAVVLRFSRFR